jgi:hypothetical protein
VAVLSGPRHHRVRLDVALVHHPRGELALDDDVRLREALLDVSPSDLDARGQIGRRARAREPLGAKVLVQDRRPGREGGVEIEHRGQHLVVDANRREGALGGGPAGRGHGGDGVAVVEHLVAGQHVAGEIPEVERGLGALGCLGGEIGKVGRGDDRLHPLDRERGLHVDGADPCVGVRAAQDLAVEHAREAQVRAEGRSPRHLVDAIRPDRPGPDGPVAGLAHLCPRSSAAAASTARTTLS